jgi:hypothetical protein
MATSVNTLSRAWEAGWKPRSTNPSTPTVRETPNLTGAPTASPGPPVGKRRDRRETGSFLRPAGDAHEAVRPQQDETNQKRGL